LADEYSQYGPLKVDTADAVVALLEPIQARFRELVEDPAATNELLAIGAEKARAVAADVYDRAVRNVGLLPRPVL
ncbi:MAG TPA: tryptophan--tRNA ligase, partial [Microthrixaceae bacterium]|nr:tryptophan--tRNA ligase [Microthrixaceae bacterium]